MEENKKTDDKGEKKVKKKTPKEKYKEIQRKPPLDEDIETIRRLHDDNDE